ncbi:MAG: phosphotransferase [Spirochaetes bacterium]|nr:phosphotransferase [Spirochaetota bacterium]MBU1079671.1 phosphotransferase [Spirochaetota bacterium]
MSDSRLGLFGYSPRPPSRHIREIKKYLGMKTLEAAIPGELKRPGKRLTHYERMGGLTNRNYKLQLGDESLVLRLPGRGTGRFINRSHERFNQYEAAKAGFSPEVLYFNKVTGIKISSFLQDALTLSPELACERAYYMRIARFLRDFHSAPVRFGNAFNGFAMSRTYETIAKARFAKFYKGYADVRNRVFALEARLAADPVEPRACHNDLVPENFLEVDGRLQLIDWEYSGMNDPAWDIGSFLLESEFATDSAEDFLAEYLGGGGAVEASLARVKAYQALQDFLWSLWSLLQASACRGSEKEAYYMRYGLERFERARRTAYAFEADYSIIRKIGK